MKRLDDVYMGILAKFFQTKVVQTSYHHYIELKTEKQEKTKAILDGGIERWWFISEQTDFHHFWNLIASQT
jgi:hypothetical protein